MKSYKEVYKMVNGLQKRADATESTDMNGLTQQGRQYLANRLRTKGFASLVDGIVGRHPLQIGQKAFDVRNKIAQAVLNGTHSPVISTAYGTNVITNNMDPIAERNKYIADWHRNVSRTPQYFDLQKDYTPRTHFPASMKYFMD